MMNQQDIFRKIGNILTELNEQYQFLAQNPEKLNDLELELFLANAHFLTDHVHIVQKLNIAGNEVKPAKEETPLPVTKELPENTFIVEQSYKEDEECFDPAELTEVATAEEEEERVDVKPMQEVLDEVENKEKIVERVLENDFFKPDKDDKTFEFILGNEPETDQFDFEAKPVEKIFDRPLTKEEEEILAQKKKIHDKDELPEESEEQVADEDDEIGPEPFLISKEEDLVVDEEIPVVPEAVIETASKPIEALKDVELDEPIISPPVEEKPIFTPEAVPIKPIVQPISEKPVPTLNDLLAKSNGNTEQIKVPITDLKQAINLNEKLLFIKDLFNGYNLAYSEAIDLVNKMTSFEAADSFLQKNYAAKNNWAAKQATVDQFYELLNRRFL